METGERENPEISVINQTKPDKRQHTAVKQE